MTTIDHRSVPGLRYRPILALGEGGMAEVYLAVGRGPSGFNKLVVLKSMRKQLAPDAELRQMFLGEARLSARLNHANVVQVYEVVDTGLPCIVMEYLEGQAMSAIHQLGEERFTPAMQMRVICDVLAGLHYSHELRDYDGTPLNVVHRDVSPQNIFVTYDGVVKVLDFGIAKAANAPGQTRTGVIKGKISYMPREQMLGESLDRRADIYAVGCLLWRAATGTKLWAEVADRDIMRCLIEGEIPRPSSQTPVDPQLEQMVMKALAPEPDARYATALELQTALDRYLTEIAPNCTMREVAAFISELFADERSQLSKTIHSSLTSPTTTPPPQQGNGVELSGHGTAVGPLAPERNKRVGTWLVTGAALVLVAAGVGYFAPGRPAHDAPASATPSAEPRLVQVRLSVIPREASVTVDGQAIAGNPAVLDVPQDRLEHEVRAVAAGYVANVRTIRFERDMSLEIALQKETSAPAASSVQSPPVGKPGPPRPHPRIAPKPGASCDPPFYFENGIKQFKPGCV